MKKIGLIDADLLFNGTRHPNLALLKLSGYYKEKGDDVILLEGYDQITGHDEVFISKVFSYTKTPDLLITDKNIHIGGTGFFPEGGEYLPYEIEHHFPDYHLYDKYIEKMITKGVNPNRFHDYQNYSIGFTTRGCFRHCDFCVNKHCNEILKHSTVSEFLDQKRYGIYLWDDNFLGFGGWEGILDDLNQTNKPFQFRQGLDIRLLTERKADKLSVSNYHGDFIFAFDDIKDKEIIEKNLKLWRRKTNKNTKLFVLCGYKSLDVQDIEDTFQRIEILMKYQCVPYIMRYEDYKNSKYKTIYISLARWCNQPQFFKKMSFRQFCEANQVYELEHHKNSRGSKAYYSMLDFEREFPKIAKKYFNLRFEDFVM